MNSTKTAILAIVLSSIALTVSAEGPNNRNSQMNAVIQARAEMMNAHAEILKAKAEIVTAKAEARKAYYEAMLTRQIVRSSALDNQLKVARTYYAKKQIRAEFLARKNNRRRTPSTSPSTGLSAQALASK